MACRKNGGPGGGNGSCGSTPKRDGSGNGQGRMKVTVNDNTKKGK